MVIIMVMADQESIRIDECIGVGDSVRAVMQHRDEPLSTLSLSYCTLGQKILLFSITRPTLFHLPPPPDPDFLTRPSTICLSVCIFGCNYAVSLEVKFTPPTLFWGSCNQNPYHKKIAKRILKINLPTLFGKAV